MRILKVKTEARRLGSLGERAAMRRLVKEGYFIRRWGYVARNHEIDIIASKGDTVIFAEVKTRTVGNSATAEPRPASSVTPEKQRGIIYAARHYASRHARNKKKRFDVIEVYVSYENGKRRVSEVKHLINAFNADTASSDLWKKKRR